MHVIVSTTFVELTFKHFNDQLNLEKNQSYFNVNTAWSVKTCMDLNHLMLKLWLVFKEAQCIVIGVISKLF